jgi:hypothetical protein
MAAVGSDASWAIWDKAQFGFAGSNRKAKSRALAAGMRK